MKEGNVSMKWYPGKCFYILKKQKKTKLKFIQTSIMLLKSNENKNLKKKNEKKFFFFNSFSVGPNLPKES